MPGLRYLLKLNEREVGWVHFLPIQTRSKGMIDFLTITVMCFLFMYADGTTTCNCRQVPIEQTKPKVVNLAQSVRSRKEAARKPRLTNE